MSVSFLSELSRSDRGPGPETGPEILDPPGEPSPEIRDDPSVALWVVGVSVS